MQRQGLEAFRQEVRGWIAANLTDDLRDAAARATSVFVDKPHAMAWQAILHRHGWAAPHWPREYGGTGWDEAQRHIFDSELAAAGAPSLSPMGLRMVAPCIMRFGTPEQKAHYLPRILSGEDFWCQGYSEPQAGSGSCQPVAPRRARWRRLCADRVEDLDDPRPFREPHVLPGAHQP